MGLTIRDLHGYTLKEWNSLCLQCGECCHNIGYDDVNNTLIVLESYCHYLKRISPTKTRCIKWPKCYGTKLDNNGTICVPVERVIHRSPNCPYNKILGPVQRPDKIIKEE